MTFDPNTTTINEEGTRALYHATQKAFVFLVDMRDDNEMLTAIVGKQKAMQFVNLLNGLHDALELARSGERKLPRVLVEYFMGKIDVSKDPGVNVCVVDFDLQQEVPPAFADLALRRTGK